MSERPVVFGRAAQREFLEARAWYDERRVGLGAEFQESVEAALQRIMQEPFAQPPIYREVRRVFIRRFPYGVFYVVEADRLVVLAVFHARRDPRAWQGRA